MLKAYYINYSQIYNIDSGDLILDDTNANNDVKEQNFTFLGKNCKLIFYLVLNNPSYFIIIMMDFLMRILQGGVYFAKY